MPVVIFHGDKDEVIYYGSSLKLKNLFKQQDTLITLHGQGHNGITENLAYRKELTRILQAEKGTGHARLLYERSEGRYCKVWVNRPNLKTTGRYTHPAW